jgi:hypothetical protein
MLRVAFAALHFTGMTAAIEWKEMCLSVFQSRRHVNLIRISREVNESARLELKQRRARIAIFFVLLDRMLPALARSRIL